jgi:hypothetical protein
MQKDKIYEVASDLYFYFIDYLDIRDKCVIDMDDYSENTDLGREIYYMIEDTIIENVQKPQTEDWSLLNEKDIRKRIKDYVKHYMKKRLH